MSNARHISNGLILVAVAALAATGCTGSASATPEPPPPPAVGVVEPVQRTLPEWEEYTGRLEAVDRVQVRARVTGYLRQVHFREGAIVEAGDLLFTLDPRTFVASRDGAQAAVDAAESRLALARSEAERVEGLTLKRAVSEEELDRRQREVDSAVAERSAARAELERAALDLDFTRIVAPIRGRIGRALVTEGNLISGGSGDATVLTTIVSIDPIHLRFPVDEPTALKLRDRVDRSTGPIPVELRLAGETTAPRTGRLDFLDNRIDEETGTLMVRAMFDNADATLVPGSFARARLQLRAPEERLLVPQRAVGLDQTQSVLMLVDGTDTVQRRVVTTGPVVDGWRVIASGLARDERVIVDGLHVARPGSTVSPQAAEVIR